MKFDARAFGAKGDGSADETEVLQDCLRRARDAGAEVFVPDGIYLSSTLVIDGPTTLILGQNAILRQNFGDDEELISLLSDDVWIEGGTLDVNRTVAPSLVESGRAIDCGEAARDNITLRKIRFTGSGQSAIQWHGGQNFKLLESVFDNNWRGAITARIVGTDDTAVDAYGFEMADNRFIAPEDATHGNAQVIIRGNGGNHDPDTNPSGLDGTRTVHGVVSRNYWRAKVTSGALPTADVGFNRGTDNAYPAQGMTCARNVSLAVTDNTLVGGLIGFSLGSFDDIEPSDSDNENNSGFSNGLVSDNHLIGQTLEAIELTARSRHNLISHNLIVQEDGVMLRGILQNSATAKFNRIEHNIVRGAREIGIDVAGGGHAQVRENDVIEAAMAGIRFGATTEKSGAHQNRIFGGGVTALGVQLLEASGVQVTQNEAFNLTGPAVRCTGGNGYEFTNILVAGNRQDDSPATFDFLATTGGYSVGANVRIYGIAPTPGLDADANGALPIHFRNLRITNSAGAAITLTVENGVPDQKLRLRAHALKGDPVTISPNAAGSSTATLTTDGQVVEFTWQQKSGGTGSWIKVSSTD